MMKKTVKLEDPTRKSWPVSLCVSKYFKKKKAGSMNVWT